MNKPKFKPGSCYRITELKAGEAVKWIGSSTKRPEYGTIKKVYEGYDAYEVEWSQGVGRTSYVFGCELLADSDTATK